MPAPAHVCALVISPDGDRGLEATLESLRSQTMPPDRVVVIECGSKVPATESSAGAAASEEPDGVREPDRGGVAGPEVVRLGAVSLRSAVAHIASREDLGPQDLLWILPVGALPDGRTLARMGETHRRSASVSMVGPKLLDGARPELLRSAGIRSTVTGRILEDPRDGSADQGQYDDRADVLAVPLVGSLVEVGLVRELGGWDSAFGDVGGDLDFGWRAQRLGRRVLLAPKARVRVASVLGRATATDGRSRRIGRRVALTRSAWWLLPIQALWLLASSLVAAVLLLLLKRPRQAWQSFAEIGALEPVSLLTARWRSWRRERRRRALLAKGSGVTPLRPLRRRDLQPLFVSGAEIRARVTDQVHDALFPSRHDDADPAPEARGSTASRLLAHPGLLAALAALGAVIIAARSWGVSTLTGLGGGLRGGELLGGKFTGSALWHSWTDNWRGNGMGGAAAAGEPHLGLLALATRLVENVPGLGSVQSPGGLVVALLVLLAPALAAFSAYVSARVVTRHRLLRAVAALVWALAGPAGPAVAQGRLGPAVAMILLPAVGAGMVLLARRDGTATSAWATALALGVLGAFAPLLLLAWVAVGLVLMLTAPTGGARLRALVPVLVGPLLLGPWALAVRDDPRLLLAGPGATSWAATDPPSWQLALLHPGGAGSTPVWLIIPLVVVAVVGLLRGRHVRSVASGAALLIVGGMAMVLAAPHVLLATVPEGLATAGGPVTPWTGLPMLLVQLGLVGAAVVGLAPESSSLLASSLAVSPSPATSAAAPTEGAGPDKRARSLRAVGMVLLAVTGIALAGGLVRATLGQHMSTWRDPRPAVAIEHTDGDVAGRTLFLVADQGKVGYQLVAREIGGVARTLPADRTADARLAPAVTALVDGTSGATGELAAAAVGIVGLPASADASLRRSLDATDGLTRLAARDGWDYWRLAAAGDVEHRPVAPPRLQLLAATDASQAGPSEAGSPASAGLEGAGVIATTGQHGATSTDLALPSGATLVVAEDPRWTRAAVVRIDDAIQQPTDGQAHPTYALPAGEHTLTISLDDANAAWRRLQAVLAGAVVFLAIPFGSRASRRRS